jgi:ATP-dependent helicase HrpA
LLDSVRDDFFEWLVPGLLVEKTLAILKGFPKRIRKQLVPLNHTAERLLDGMNPYQGNYYQQLAGRIFTLFKLGIQPDDWPRDIPDHLRMRFVIVDGTDKEITSGRDLGFLRKTMHGKNLHEQASIDKKAQEIIDQVAEKVFTDYQFDHYPSHLCLRNEVGEITGMRYAALDSASSQQGVKLIYVDNREEADHLNDVRDSAAV